MSPYTYKGFAICPDHWGWRFEADSNDWMDGAGGRGESAEDCEAQIDQFLWATPSPFQERYE